MSMVNDFATFSLIAALATVESDEPNTCGCITHKGPHWLHMLRFDLEREKAAYARFVQAELRLERSKTALAELCEFFGRPPELIEFMTARTECAMAGEAWRRCVVEIINERMYTQQVKL